jgi:hypothetical protein
VTKELGTSSEYIYALNRRTSMGSLCRQIHFFVSGTGVCSDAVSVQDSSGMVDMQPDALLAQMTDRHLIYRTWRTGAESQTVLPFEVEQAPRDGPGNSAQEILF